jgi:hypothetical protein
MKNGTRHALLLVAMIASDAALLQVLQICVDLPTPAGRLLSLSAALLITWPLARVLPASPRATRRPGLLPLAVVALLLNMGIFVTLTLRTPEIQPLVHLAASWIGALLFAGFGTWRIRRWRDDA